MFTLLLSNLHHSIQEMGAVCLGEVSLLPDRCFAFPKSVERALMGGYA